MEQAISQAPQRYTVQEYFRLEADSPLKHEYRDGQIIDMAGGTESHSLITTNVIAGLVNRVKGKPCRVYDSNLRVRALRGVLYSYPDVLVVCGERQFDEEDARHLTVSNPKLVVEVLSPSTERDDRGWKFERYILCPSLEEYVLVTQDRPRVETFHRQNDGTWSFAYFDGIDGAAKLRSLGVEIPMSEVYAGVEFPAAPEPGSTNSQSDSARPESRPAPPPG